MVDIPKQAIDAVAKAIADSIGHGMSEKCFDHARAALTAAAPYMSGAKVKQLEWVESESYVVATTEIGTYYVYPPDEDFDLDQSWRCSDLDGDTIGQFKDMESAKAAAQDDFEKLIVSALEISSVHEHVYDELEKASG